jgi:hypothetical protein
VIEVNIELVYLKREECVKSGHYIEEIVVFDEEN